MNVNLVKPRKALNKAFLKVKPNRSEIENFKANLIQLLDTINESESEEFHKNLVSQFLKDTYYKDNHFINTKGRTDLVVHNGKDAKSSVGVIIEAKKPTNKSEMLRKDKINTKALQELVLYYLRERITQKNLEIKYVVATNIYEWFIFDAGIFEREFAQNKTLVKQFRDFEEERLSGTKTDFFYKEIAEPAIEKIKNEIDFIWFDIREYDKPLRNDDKKDDNKLIALYKLLSPEHLLKLPFTNDSNSLDKSFYAELLHIIGLSETKEGSKKLIGRKAEGERNQGSLIENTMTILQYEDCLSMIKASNYGANKQEQLYTIALELVITWINRILFLKLLEGQLIKYHKGDSSYKFLNIEQIPDYDALNKLFFQVLAIKESDRNELVKQKFGKIPYLNSSLFEPNELEHKTIRISNLEDEYSIPLLSSTVLKDKTGKRLKGGKNTLEYLFSFLDAYDFASEGAEDIQEDNKTLINASVLGLIFEKINGYKDGSFFTPGFITMYMARETIRRAVVQKFNEAKNWDIKEFDELYDKIENKKEANEIINSLKICDPAVGSGHFLVSALNEIIAIKSELKVLLDGEGKTLRDYHVEVVNDELIVTDEDGQFFEYNPNSRESQRVQETLFHEKQTIIENCLFGVDINPNSVKICRLRLWIELLKNAYYKTELSEGMIQSQTPANSGINRKLETLPNIDINIKAGNSLISRYALDADIKKALKKSKWTIDSYRLAVMTYRNAKTKEEKQSMARLIDQIKNDFESEIAANDKRVLRLNKLKGELYSLTTQTQIFEQTKKEKAEWNKKVKKLTDSINKLETELEEIINNKIYENAFEWRFEFPEVLNDDGDFVGFDVIIGNPPYVDIRSIKNQYKKFFNEFYPEQKNSYDLFSLFIERSIKLLINNGSFHFIVPKPILYNKTFSPIRRLIFSNQLINIYVHNYLVFEDANVETCLLQVEKSRTSKNFILNSDTYKLKQKYSNEYELGKSIILADYDTLTLLEKLNSFEKLGSVTNIIRGLELGKNTLERISSSENATKLFAGEAIEKFKTFDKKFYFVRSNEVKKFIKENTIFEQYPRLLVRRVANEPISTIIENGEKIINNLNSIYNIAINENTPYSKYFFCGILNSNIVKFFIQKTYSSEEKLFPYIRIEQLKQIPIPQYEPVLDKLVKKILDYFNKDIEAKEIDLENKINQLVYQLYGLTEEEIEIVENS